MTKNGLPWNTCVMLSVCLHDCQRLLSTAFNHSLFQSLGNHDFDTGVPGLTPFIRNLTCPVLACNLILTDEPELQAETNLMKSVVFDIDGIQVGVIGYLTPETRFEAIANNVDYIEEITAIRQEAAVLKNKGVQILIALGHSGFLKDLEIAKEVEDIDLVIGGHTHTFLWNGARPDTEDPVGPYPTIVEQESGRLVPVVQASAYTKYLGKLHITFNSDGEIISYNGNPILLDVTIPQDSQVLKILNFYHDKVLKVTEQVIGNTLVFINGNTCRIKECNMGNLITDAMIYKYASTYRGHGWTDAPIAVILSGGIRSSFRERGLPSNITIGDLLLVMPFDGVLVKVAISGDAILRMLEHSVHAYNPLYPSGQLLQMSGMRVKYDLTQPPKKRVVNVSLRCGKCLYPEYFTLNKTEEYNILMPAFLANGGDGFFTLDDLPVTDINMDQIQSTEAYIKSHSPLYPGVEGRILFHNTTHNAYVVESNFK